MYKAESSLLSEPGLPPEEKPKTPVLLTDSDGTIFQGNMHHVVGAVIRFLEKEPNERSSMGELFTHLDRHLPKETQALLQPWLKKQGTIDRTKPEELLDLQQTLAGFFPLIHYQGTVLDEKISYTSLDVFRAVWAKQGIVMILTFNIYAPQTIRQALIQKGLSEEEAQQIAIICPGSDAIPPNNRIFACKPPGDGQAMNKNGFIQEAKRICREEFKLPDCQYIFVDDQHAQAAQLKSSGLGVKTVTGDYADGQHWQAVISLITGQRSDSPVSHHSSPASQIFDIGGEGDTPVLKSLHIRNESGNGSLISSSPSIPAVKHARTLPDLELPPMMQPSSSSQLTPPTARRSLAQQTSSSQNLASPRSQKWSLASNFFPATASSRSDVSSVTPSTSIAQGNTLPADRILDKQFIPSSRYEEMDSSHATLLSKQPHHHRIDVARQEELDSNLNPMSSLSVDDSQTTAEILEGTDEHSLMFPRPLAHTFNDAYAHADTLKQKIKTLTRAIEHFYPQTVHTLEGASFRFMTTNPHRELQQWIQKWDALFIAHQSNPSAQLELANAAKTFWTTLQISSAEETTVEEKKRSPSRDASDASNDSLRSTPTGKEIVRFLFSRADESDKSTPTTPSPPTSLAVKELEKWRQHHLTLTQSVETPAPTVQSSCCCLIS